MQLLARLLDYDPTSRITAEVALSDPFFHEVRGVHAKIAPECGNLWLLVAAAAVNADCI